MKIINKRIIYVTVLVLILFVVALIKVGYVIALKGEDYIERAYDLWSRNIPISYKRGRIYDCNGKLIVGNTLSPSISIIPKQIKDKEYTINYLSTILNVDKSSLEKHFNKNVSIELLKPIGKNIPIEKAKQIIAKGLDGVYLTGDVVRFYPYKNVLSQVIGIVGSDNIGLSGLEYKYDDLLKGSLGSLNVFTDAHGIKLYNISDYIKEPDCAFDLYLTINIDLQLALEEAIKNACLLYDSDTSFALMLEPNTSKVLAICSYPSFDLANYQDYDQEIYNRINPIWYTYEYGSTFKFVTYSAGIEENIFSPTDPYFCPGYKVVSGRRIKDWKIKGHGSIDYYGVIENSCNPGFMDIGLKLGKDKLFEYIKRYGFGSLTGIDLVGESKGILFDVDKVTLVDVATSSFGQANSGTAIQLVNAVCACVNGGYLHKPYVVNAIGIDDNIIYKKEKEFVRRVISTRTSNITKDALERVVALGTGRSAYIEGYRVGGKTGVLPF